jgi:hypothetical protein
VEKENPTNTILAETSSAGDRSYTPGNLSSRCIEPSVNGEITRQPHFSLKLDEKIAGNEKMFDVYANKLNTRNAEKQSMG